MSTLEDGILEHNSPFLQPSASNEQKQQLMVLVVLNTPIKNPPSPLFDKLWNFSSYRVCADGGANRLYEANKDLLPDLIRGDLDSLKAHVRSYYSATTTTKIEKDPDQDCNDLDKALQAVVNKYYSDKTSSSLSTSPLVCIYGAFGGRFDQEMASIQALYKWSETFQHKLTLYDDNTCAFLLPAHVKNIIRLPFFGETNAEDNDNKKKIGEGPTCGLIPLGHRCDSVQTTGFKWDLDGQVPLEFGGLVSTSNHVMKAEATVQSSHSLIFTAEIMDGT